MMTLALLAALALAAPAAPRVPLGGDYWHTDGANDPALWGMADLHAHFFTDLAYGGRAFAGKAWAPHGAAQALHDCRRDHAGINAEGPHATGGYPGFEGWPRWSSLTHQQAYVEWLKRAWQGGLRLVQMDVQNTPFLGEAYEALNGTFLRGDLTPLPNDNRSALWLQTQAARALFVTGPGKDFAEIAYSAADAKRIIAAGKLAVVLGIEVEALGDFIEEAQLGAQPEQTVRDLVDTLYRAGIRHVIPVHLTINAFGHPAVFHRTLQAMNYSDTGRGYAVEDGFDRGVRFDLSRMGSDPLTVYFELAASVHGKAMVPSLRATAAAKGLTEAGKVLVEELIRRGMVVDVDHMSEQAVDETLTIAEALHAPVISSHTHFRDLSFGTTLSFGESPGEYTAEVVALPYSEAPERYGTSDVSKVRTDRSRTRTQLERLKALGGMVGVQLGSTGVGTAWRAHVRNDCDGSSKSLAQLLLYASELMGGRGVTLGTDVGGFSPMVAPRFGPEACPGAANDALRSRGALRRLQMLAQRGGVAYSTRLRSKAAWGRAPLPPAEGLYSPDELRAWHADVSEPAPDPLVRERLRAMHGPNVPLTRARTGTREWDVNLDGMAHYGLLPDALQDVANVLRGDERPGTAAEKTVFGSLFSSAEHYVMMWQRLEQH